MTLQKLHSTAAQGSASSAAYHIVTLPAAQTYVDQRRGAPRPAQFAPATEAAA